MPNLATLKKIITKKRVQELIRNNAMLLSTLTLVFAIFAAVFLAYLLEKDPEVSNVRIANLSSNSATITWTTTERSRGEVIYKDKDSFSGFPFNVLGRPDVAYEDRDVEFNEEENTYEFSDELFSKRRVHHVTLRDLDPDTTYYFRINGDLREYKTETEFFTTRSLPESVDEPDPMYGYVDYLVTEENLDVPIAGIVLYRVIETDNQNERSQLHSSVITRDATWSGDLSNLMADNEEKFEWDASTHSLIVEVRSTQGNTKTQLYLEKHKPLKTINIDSGFILDVNL